MSGLLVFRPHRPYDWPDGVDPLATPATLWEDLAVEWIRLHASAANASLLRSWARTEPALAGLDRVGDIVDAIDGADDAGKDEIWRALLRVFHRGQQFAGRIMLQALLPRLCRLVDRHVHAEARVCQAQTLAHFWTVLHKVDPQTRTQSVAGGIAQDVFRETLIASGWYDGHEEFSCDPDFLNRLSDAGAIEALPSHLNDYGDATTDDAATLTTLYRVDLAHGSVPVHSMAAIVDWAIEHEVISSADGEDLLAYAHTEGDRNATCDSTRALARRRQISVEAVRQRRSRTIRRIAAAVGPAALRAGAVA